RRTTPVGVFPGGVTPEGLVDMSGNTWDWTGTRYERYPYDAGDGREEGTGAAPRVLRGGSWGSDLDFARAAFRVPSDPDARDDILGLRVVCSSPIV
ncbi:MAG: formylglycine-generating enzyme family protein, partial [bacterium]